MNSKIVVQVALLAVVGASVVAWAWKSFTKATPTASPMAAPGEVPSAPAAPVASVPGQVLADGVAVINFHGMRR